MWLRSKNMMDSHIHGAGNSFNHSWEEQAFAEDASGPLGGFIWPPRSYSCNFCKREFRSAQALGGHMNVHRRDRAKLKESIGPHSEVLLQHQNHTHSLSKSMGTQDISQVCISSSALASLKASAPPTQEKLKKNALLSPFSSAFQENYKQKVFCSVPFSLSDSQKVSLLGNSTSKPASGKYQRKEKSVSSDNDNCLETNLSMGLNLAVTPTGKIRSDDGDDQEIPRKRHKTAVLQFPLFLRPCLDEKYPFQSDIVGWKTSFIEDNMDLELRLGDSPLVK